MKYLPPKMKIEGHGIKRGLTAVEAAIVMEQPMDKVLTMILFGTLKKEATTVIQQEPLILENSDPLPEDLHPYEVDFLKAFAEPETKRKAALQKLMVDLINSVSQKMKGFSRKETVAYYEDIMRRAWLMVEQAETPEVKSERYDQTLEWTMLDDEYADRTRRTFTGPVFVPIWWPRYSPSYRRNITRMGGTPISTGNISTGGGSKGSVSLPHIPGSDFAAGVINGVTGMAAGAVGNLTSFTSGITNRTNPIPVATKGGSGGFRGGGGGGGGCACACACAGGACPAPAAAANYSNSTSLLVLSAPGATSFLMTSTNHTSNAKKAFQKPSLPSVGIYHYRRESEEEKSRLHLRIDPDGSGLLIVNSNRVVHLNPSAAQMAFCHLEGYSRARLNGRSCGSSKSHPPRRKTIFGSSPGSLKNCLSPMEPVPFVKWTWRRQHLSAPGLQHHTAWIWPSRTGATTIAAIVTTPVLAACRVYPLRIGNA